MPIPFPLYVSCHYRCGSEENIVMKALPKENMQDDDNEEKSVDEDLGTPPMATLVKEEGKSSDESDEEGYVNDEMGPPQKV